MKKVRSSKTLKSGELHVELTTLRETSTLICEPRRDGESGGRRSRPGEEWIEKMGWWKSLKKQDLKPPHILRAAVGSELEREDQTYTDGLESKQHQHRSEVWLPSIFSHAGLGEEEERSTCLVPRSTGEASWSLGAIFLRQFLKGLLPAEDLWLQTAAGNISNCRLLSAHVGFSRWGRTSLEVS